MNTIESQVYTAEQLDRMPWLTNEERHRLATPITPKQISYIMLLAWNTNRANFAAVANFGTKTPTAADLEQLNQAQAHTLIEGMKGKIQQRYGLDSMRKLVAREDYGWSRYLGDISDHTIDL